MSNPFAVEGLAGRGARLAAYLIDYVLVLAVVGGIAWYAGLIERAMQQPTEAGLWLLVIFMVVYAVINGRLLATRGQTVGKMAAGVRIVDARTRQIVPFWKSFGLRVFLVQALAMVPTVGAIFSLVDILFIFGERRRCLHDHIAGTVVVRAEDS